VRFCAKLCTICIFGAASLALAADQDVDKGSKHVFPKVRLGGVFIGANYTHFGGGYPFWGFGAYAPLYAGYSAFGFDPFFFGPYIHPGYYAGFGYGPSLGELKLQSVDKSAWVYLDGALAGRAEKLKTMWLEPGAYDLELRGGNGRPEDTLFSKRIYVLTGKTFKITTAMMNSREARP
jgi:hypothetical protein